MKRALRRFAIALLSVPTLLSAQPSRSIDTAGAFLPPTYDSASLASALTHSAAALDSGNVMVAFVTLLIDSTGKAIDVTPRDREDRFGIAASDDIRRIGGFQAGRLDGAPVNTMLALRIRHAPGAHGGIAIDITGVEHGEGVDIALTDLIYPESPPGATTSALPGFENSTSSIRYPEEAEENGIEGMVFVKARIDEKGRVQGVLILKHVHPLLDAEAVRVVSEMRFVPAEREGTPIKSSLKIPIAFKLD